MNEDHADSVRSEDDAPNPREVVPTAYLYPFILVTTLFALWGFANDITNPLVRAFKEIFLISNAQSSLAQWAFYGGYTRWLLTGRRQSEGAVSVSLA